jgi:hypothetical protein
VRIILITYLYKLIIAMVNNPATNPTNAKVMAVIFIAFPPWKKKEVRVCVFPCSLPFFASSDK